jgi:hypothetical protein
MKSNASTTTIITSDKATAKAKALAEVNSAKASGHSIYEETPGDHVAAAIADVEMRNLPKVDKRVHKMEKRAGKLSELVFVKLETRPSFRCAICKGKGKNALVFKDAGGKEVTLGWTCLKRVGIDADDIKDIIDDQEGI